MKENPYKVIEFYLPWILKQFKLPPKFKIFLLDGINEKRPLNNGYYNYVNKEVVLYMGRFKTLDDCIKCLAHELKHVEQYFIRQLTVGWYRNRIWKDLETDKSYSYSEDVCESQYYNLPWEIEARKAGDELFDKLVKRHNNRNIFRILDWKWFKHTERKYYEINL